MKGITFYQDFGSFLGSSLSKLSIFRIPFISGRSGATRPGTIKNIDLKESRSKNQHVPYGSESNVNDSTPTYTEYNNSEDLSLVAIWQSLSPEEKMAQFAYEGSTHPYFTSFVPSSIINTSTRSNTKSNPTQFEDNSNLDSGNTTPTSSTGISSASSSSSLCTPDTSPDLTPPPAGPERMNAVYEDDHVDIKRMILALTSDLGITHDQRNIMIDTVKNYRLHDELTLWVDREGHGRGVKLILEGGRRKWAIWKEV